MVQVVAQPPLTRTTTARTADRTARELATGVVVIGGDGRGGGRPVPPPPSGQLIRDGGPTIEERDLIARVRDGDDLAFARLYEQHWDSIYRLLVRVTGDGDLAGDVAQEVFVQLYRKPPGASAPLRAWLYRVAVNRGYNALRTDKRRRTREDAAAHDPLGAVVDPSSMEEANRAEERDAVRRALLQLPERQRECLALRAEGLSYAEMAAALGVAPGSVGTLLARAERAFKETYVAQRGGL
jgi:RNA polymerase sigma-70 factor (ECF subfamily)